PRSSELAVTPAPVAVFLTVTLAPGTTAPFGSLTVPSRAPRICWATATGLNITTIKRNPNTPKSNEDHVFEQLRVSPFPRRSLYVSGRIRFRIIHLTEV